MRIRSIAAAGALGLAVSANADVLRERFEGGIPATWSTVDYQPGGSAIIWGVSADTAHGNYTGDDGLAAMVNSGAAGDGIEFDLALLTPVLHLPSADDLRLTFRANYQNFAGSDFADVDIDAGSGWVNLLRWNEDHGDSFFRAIGEDVSLDLNAFAGSDVRLRFHYYDPNVSDWDWYWQIDDVNVTPSPGPMTVGAMVLLAGARRRRRG